MGLFAGERILIIVPEIDSIDLESLRAIRLMLSALRDRAEVHLVIGDNSGFVPSAPIDAFFRSRRRAMLAQLEALPITDLQIATAQAIANDVDMAIDPDPLDDNLEAGAFAALASDEPRNAGTISTLAVAAIRAAFDAFALEPAFRLAQALLTRADSDDAQTRDAIRLSALALNHLAPFANETWINDMLVDRFSRLLDSETDPLARAHWNYRLTLVHARGRSALDTALETGNAAVASAEEAVGEPSAPLFLAWAHNGRAYVRARRSDFQGAAEDTEAGLGVLENGAPGVPETEITLTRVLLANNRARVAQMAGDSAALVFWRSIRTQHLNRLPVYEHPGPLWLPVPGGHRDLAAQRDHHATVLAEARERFDVEDEAIAAHGLGVTLYKMGNARGAHEAFATSLRIWSVIGGLPEDLLTEEFNTAVTAFRSGDTARAAEGFERIRAVLREDSGAQVETLAALAMIDARAGERERATSRATDAIHDAEELREPDIYVRTSRSAAEAHLILGNRSRASEILAAARVAIAAAERESVELSPEDIFGVLVSDLDAAEVHDMTVLQSRSLSSAPL